MKKEINEINTITHKGRIIAHHFWNVNSGWLVVFEEDISEEEKSEFEKNIKETADRNNIIVEFK